MFLIWVIVITYLHKYIGLSKRIESRQERDRIRKIIEELKLPKDIGFIIRTAAQGASQKDFFRESKYLLNLWQHIKAKAKKASETKFTCPECAQNAWAKADALLICGTCYEDGEGDLLLMVAAPADEAEAA